MKTSFVDDLTNYVADFYPQFSSPIRWVILSNGDAEYQDSVILFGFEEGNKDPSLVAKTPRLPENGWVLKIEYDRLVELWDLLGAKAPQRLPRPVAMVTLQKQAALIISHVQGESLVRISKKAFWNDPLQVQALAVDAARSFREIIDLTATPLAVGEQVPSDISQKVERFIQTYHPSENELHVLAEILEQVKASQAKASHKALIQGDFWHGNIIRSADHGQMMFIDWQYSRWAADVSLDVYLFLLAGAMASAPQNPVDERVRGTVDTLLTWRTEVIPAYLAAFGKPVGYSLLPLKTGLLACCVEMAVRVNMDFGYNHVDDTVWRLIFAELLNWPEEDK